MCQPWPLRRWPASPQSTTLPQPSRHLHLGPGWFGKFILCILLYPCTSMVHPGSWVYQGTTGTTGPFLGGCVPGGGVERVCWKPVCSQQRQRGRQGTSSRGAVCSCRDWVFPFASLRAKGNGMLLGNAAGELAHKCPRAYVRTAGQQPVSRTLQR